MFYGQKIKTVNLPDDLFVDPDGDTLEYSTTVCVDYELPYSMLSSPPLSSTL